jgi:hypothetical protein
MSLLSSILARGSVNRKSVEIITYFGMDRSGAERPGRRLGLSRQLKAESELLRILRSSIDSNDRCVYIGNLCPAADD